MFLPPVWILNRKISTVEIDCEEMTQNYGERISFQKMKMEKIEKRKQSSTLLYSFWRKMFGIVSSLPN